MKEQSITRHEMLGHQIRMQTDTGMMCATDLKSLADNWRRDNSLGEFNMTVYLRSKSTKEFVSELEDKYGEVIVKGRGRNSLTWVHPMLFIDIALAINPKLKVEIYEWLFKKLELYRYSHYMVKGKYFLLRSDPSTVYTDMCGALWARTEYKRGFAKFMRSVDMTVLRACKVNDWQSATPEQLRLRDKIYNSIKTLTSVLRNPSEAVRLGVKEHVNP